MPVRALRTFAVIFAATGIPSGLVVGLGAAVVLGATGESPGRAAALGLAVGVGVAVFFGGIMALVLGSVDAVSDRAPQDARPGPRQDTAVQVRAGADLSERIVAALRGLPADVREADVAAGRYRARTRWSWKSWGEEVTVQLSGDGAALEAVVSSRPVVGTTVVDYGKGRSNVAAVAEALRH